VKMKKIMNAIIGSIFLIIGMFYASLSMAAALNASIDRQVVSISESFILKIEADDISSSAEPDFSSLEPDFEVLSKNVSHQYQSINGVNSRSTHWQLQLQAKRLGEIEIASLSLAGVSSRALIIKVEKQKITAKDDADFSLQLLANKKFAIEQEQIVVTLRFSFAKHVSNLQASELLLDNAQVVKLNDKQYETRRNGRHFGVYEVNYAIFAKSVGEIIIPAQKIQVQLGRGSIFNQSRGKTIALQSDALKIDISQGPKSQQNYVVADSLSLNESWAGSHVLVLGESITREISLNLTGAKAETIAALSMGDIEDVKIYPEVANKNEKKTDEGLVTSRIRSFALVPTKAGKIVVPAFEVRWWNTLENKFETARLAAKTIEVRAPAASSDQTIVDASRLQQQAPVKVEKVIEKVLIANPINHWLSAISLLLAGIVVYLLWVIFADKKNEKVLKNTHQNHLSSQEKQLFEKLLSALKQGSDANIYHSTRRWALSLGVSLASDEILQKSLTLIEQHLYSADEASVKWDKQEFTLALKALRQCSLAKVERNQPLTLYPQYSGEAR